MKALRVLLLIGILLALLAGSAVVLVRGWNWYYNLTLPRSVKPETGTTVWAPPPGAVGASLDGPLEAPMPRSEADRVLRNPKSATPESLANGKQSYEQFCLVCHGPAGHGDGPIANKLLLPLPDLPVTLGNRSDGFLYATIRNGGVLMPPQGYRIPPGERWDLVNYLRSIAPPVQTISQAPAPTVVAPTPTVSRDDRAQEEERQQPETRGGDAAKGKEVFESKCQICHDANSEQARVGPGLKGLFQRHRHASPEDAEHEHTEAAIRAQIVNGSGAMPPMGSALSEEQLDDLVAYLKTL